MVAKQSPLRYPDPGYALLDLLRKNNERGNLPKLIGLAGPQGSGKSTAAAKLMETPECMGIVLSLDDFYLGKDRRLILAHSISPLFETRGPPGTHDIPLLMKTLKAIQTASVEAPVWIPKFDKLLDDRLPKDEWVQLNETPDFIQLEGWCVGALAPPNFCGEQPMNAIESHDRDGAWRAYQVEQLQGPYRTLWEEIDAFYYLKPPSFESVFHWRLQQEAMLREVAIEDLPKSASDWVQEFIQYYERLSRAMAEGARMPGTVLQLDEERRVVNVRHEG